MRSSGCRIQFRARTPMNIDVHNNTARPSYSSDTAHTEGFRPHPHNCSIIRLTVRCIMNIRSYLRCTSILVAALVLSTLAPTTARSQGTVVVVNNTACTISVTTSSVSALVPPGTHNVLAGCPESAVTVYSCGSPVSVPVGECRKDLWLDGCCHADVCLAPGADERCRYTLTITPRGGHCPCTED